MRSPDELDSSSSGRTSKSATVHRRRRSAGESQMAHSNRPRRPCRDNYQPAGTDRLFGEHTTEPDIHDECPRWTFECIDVASPF
jgi:hypothetical protein